MNLHKFKTVEDAALYLKTSLEEKINELLYENEMVIFLLPGGNSIKLFFPYLAQMHIDWNKIIISLTDERRVPVDHEMSNEKQLRELFLNKLISYNFLPLENTLIEKLKLYSCVSLLSMGLDGHLASLFPDDYEYWKDYEDEIYRTHNQTISRITITTKVFNRSENYILVAGFDKKKKIQKIILNPNFYLSNVYRNATIIIC